MRIWLRTFVLFSVVSFLLGLWLSLKHSERDLFRRLKQPPTVRILTDQPQWWQSIAEQAETEGVALIEVMSPPRREWQTLFNDESSRCDLVAFKSLFFSEYQGKSWIEGVPDQQQGLWQLLHPDFHDVPKNSQGLYLPLGWSVTTWQKTENASGQWQIESNVDDILTTAMEQTGAINENTLPEAETDLNDPQQLAENLWLQLKSKVHLRFFEPEYNIPLEPVSAIQTNSTVWSDSTSSSPSHSDGNQFDLWTYGVSFCKGRFKSETLAFVEWLVQADTLRLLLDSSRLASTLTSHDHQPNLSQRPSNLRTFPLGQIKIRELPWDLAVAWEDLLKPRPNNAASR